MPISHCGTSTNRQTNEVVEEWFLSQNANIFHDGTATCINRCTGGLSTSDIIAANNAWPTGTEWTVGQNIGSNHLPKTTTIRCEVQVASASNRIARWNKSNVDWNSFPVEPRKR